MNQVETSTNKPVARPSPLFGSTWLALYGFLRDYPDREGPKTESTVVPGKARVARQL